MEVTLREKCLAIVEKRGDMKGGDMQGGPGNGQPDADMEKPQGSAPPDALSDSK